MNCILLLTVDSFMITVYMRYEPSSCVDSKLPQSSRRLNRVKELGVKISMERRKWDHKSLKVNLCDIFIYNHHRSSFDMLLLLWLVFAEISSLLIAPKQQPTHILNVTLISTWADFDRLQLSLPLYLDRRRDRFRSCLSFSVTKKKTPSTSTTTIHRLLSLVYKRFSRHQIEKKSHFALLYVSVWSFAQ